MISYKWNFLAEACLRSLPGHVRPFVIHNGKGKARVAKFQPDRLPRNQWHVDECQHGRILDSLWSNPTFGEILDCDVLIFMDHDCWFGKAFHQVEQVVVGAIVGGAVIAARPIPIPGLFATSPAFAVKPIIHWPESWSEVRRGESTWRDTGHAIALSVPQHLLAFVPVTCEMHWGGNWLWLNHAATNTHRRAWSKKLVHASHHYRQLLATGNWRPKNEELQELNQYPLLRDGIHVYLKGNSDHRERSS